jgi:hypothetical protein
MLQAVCISKLLRITPMGPLDALWHLANLFAPAVSVGLTTALLAKLVWRRALAGQRWQRLSIWAVGAATAAWLGGLFLFGRDGKMTSYAVMVLACALSLWWAGFLAKR